MIIVPVIIKRDQALIYATGISRDPCGFFRLKEISDNLARSALFTKNNQL